MDEMMWHLEHDGRRRAGDVRPGDGFEAWRADTVRREPQPRASGEDEDAAFAAWLVSNVDRDAEIAREIRIEKQRGLSWHWEQARLIREDEKARQEARRVKAASRRERLTFALVTLCYLAGAAGAALAILRVL